MLNAWVKKIGELTIDSHPESGEPKIILERCNDLVGGDIVGFQMCCGIRKKAVEESTEEDSERKKRFEKQMKGIFKITILYFALMIPFTWHFTERGFFQSIVAASVFYIIIWIIPFVVMFILFTIFYPKQVYHKLRTVSYREGGD